jgi:hypothetical protein
MVPAAVIVFVITQQTPPILLLALAIVLYLTVWELWNEDMPFLTKAWWVLLVFLLHVIGYLIFRVFIAARRRGRGAQP